MKRKYSAMCCQSCGGVLPNILLTLGFTVCDECRDKVTAQAKKRYIKNANAYYNKLSRANRGER